MRQSTKNFAKAIKVWRHPIYFLHGYLYFTQYDRYVKVCLQLLRPYIRVFPRGRWLFDYLTDRYHFKMMTKEQVTQVLTLDHDVAIDGDLAAKVIPFPIANRILLSQPQNIAVMDCPCRLEKGEDACRPVNVCLAVGEPVVSFWLEHGEKYHVRRVSSEEAIKLMEEERARGHIQSAWFKDATGGKTGVFCNCCSCCCAGMEAVRTTRLLQVADPPAVGAPSGYAARVDRELCSGCGACAGACHFEAIEMDGENRSLTVYSRCMGCGICVEACAAGARSLVRDERKGLPLDIRVLEAMQSSPAVRD